MTSHTSDLSGKIVYIRHADDYTRLPKDTKFDTLVGDGKLVSCPNDVVVGQGSNWTHPQSEKYIYGVYGQRTRWTKMGRDGSARCVLVLPGDWWRELFNKRLGDNALAYADIAYAVGDDKEVVYAARFMSMKRPVGLFGVDRTKDIRVGFSSSGGELVLRSPG